MEAMFPKWNILVFMSQGSTELGINVGLSVSLRDIHFVKQLTRTYE